MARPPLLLPCGVVLVPYGSRLFDRRDDALSERNAGAQVRDQIRSRAVPCGPFERLHNRLIGRRGEPAATVSGPDQCAWPGVMDQHPESILSALHLRTGSDLRCAHRCIRCGRCSGHSRHDRGRRVGKAHESRHLAEH